MLLGGNEAVKYPWKFKFMKELWTSKQSDYESQQVDG